MYIHICDIFNKSFNQRSLIKQIICSINIDIFFNKNVYNYINKFQIFLINFLILVCYLVFESI